MNAIIIRGRVRELQLSGRRRVQRLEGTTGPLHFRLALIKGHSQLYISNKKDDPANTFIFPIVAAFSADSTVTETMRLAQILAAVNKDPEPEPLAIFKVLSSRFPFSKSLADLLPLEPSGIVTLKRVHDLSEYLQCPKSFCLRLLQSVEGETFRTIAKDTHVSGITGSATLKPLYSAAEFYISEIPVPEIDAASIRASSLRGGYSGDKIYRGTRHQLNLKGLLSHHLVLLGAFNYPPAQVGGLLGTSFADLAVSNLQYLLGQALGGHPLSKPILTAVNSQVTLAYQGHLDVATRDSITGWANTALEAMAVMGRVAEVSSLASEGGVKYSPFMKEIADHIGFASFPGL